MRLAIVIAALLAGCYSPQLDRCRITCADGAACPGAQVCRADNFCHAPADELLCTPDARAPDADLVDAEPDAEPYDAEPPDAMPPVGVVHVTTGGDHACALTQDARVVCWGLNSNGEVGLDPSPNLRVPTPVDVGGAAGWDAIDAGDQHTCGIRDGVLYCWGRNVDGQCGFGGGNTIIGPQAPTGFGTGWLSVSAGARHTCGIRDDGGGAHNLYCWGHNAVGQVGNGTTDATVRGTIYPLVAATDGTHADWELVAAGSENTCAIRANHTAYCWGDNGALQLGTGATAGVHPTPTPVAAADDSQATFRSIQPYFLAACAVGDNGGLYCWGDNTYRQLGIDGQGPTSTPLRVGAGTDWQHVTLGYLHACGARADRVECWGSGIRGATGNGEWEHEPVPVPVVGLGAGAQVSMGYDFACASAGAAGAFCWGDNRDGALGNGEISMKREPALVQPADGAWTMVRAGQSHTCGVHAGRVMCWGWNIDGQTAFPASEGSDVPVDVPSLTGTASEVAVGTYHSCALIDTGSGVHPWCWGRNTDGQVGNGVAGINAPDEIVSAGLWTKLVATGRATCALAGGTQRSCWGVGSGHGLGNNSISPVAMPTIYDDGIAWANHSLGYLSGCGIHNTLALSCWGIDSTQQQGDGATIEEAEVPHVVDSGVTYTDVASAWEGAHVCGIAGGALKCWGRNDRSQCGIDSDAEPVNVPTLVPSTGTWQEVAAGIEQTCAIKDDADTGELHCWGLNDFGSVGGETLLVATPERLGTDSGWTGVTIGWKHACAIRGGNAYCWGDSIHGQVGDGESGHATPQPVELPPP